MKQMIVIIGVIIVVIGALLMGVGQMMRDAAAPTIVECNTITGTARQIFDTEYRTQCVDAVNSYNSGGMICFGGVPMLIVGIIVLIVGAIMKGTPKPIPPQPTPYQQPMQPYTPAPAYQQPQAQPYGPPPQYQQPPPTNQYQPQQAPPQYPPQPPVQQYAPPPQPQQYPPQPPHY